MNDIPHSSIPDIPDSCTVILDVARKKKDIELMTKASLKEGGSQLGDLSWGNIIDLNLISNQH